MEFDNSAASPRPTSFGSTLDISRRRDMTSSRISRLTNLRTIGFGPFVALRAGIINRDVTAHSLKDTNTGFRRVYSRLFRTCLGTPTSLTFKL